MKQDHGSWSPYLAGARRIVITDPFIQSFYQTRNLMEAAANLFAALRRLDATGAATIAEMPIPTSPGLGEAINDRLARAAAPR